MKIIYDNTIFSLQRVGGISNYWYQLAKRLQESNDKNIVFYELENENLFRKNLTLRSLKESIFPIQLLRYLPFTKSLPCKSIFHSSYYRVCLQRDIVNVTTVYDFIYEYYSDRLAPSKLAHSFQKRFSVTHSQGVICISESTKKDLLHFYPSIDPEIVRVIYLGVDEEFQPLTNKKSHLSQFNLPIESSKYIIYVGSRISRKNFLKVVEATILNSDLSLVVVGGDDFSSLEKDLLRPLRNRVFHLKGIDAKKLNILYNNAFCLLYPSIYEGFGIPPLEAMKSGCPVISCNSSSIPEVVGSAGLLVKDVNTSSLLEQMNILRNKSTREEIITRGIERAKRFSWNRCFDETIKFYEEVYERSL